MKLTVLTSDRSRSAGVIRKNSATCARAAASSSDFSAAVMKLMLRSPSINVKEPLGQKQKREGPLLIERPPVS